MSALCRARNRKGVPGHYLADLTNNGISVLARLLAGVGVFVVIARYMGPSGFGDFMYAMAIATLAAFASTLGFVPMTLREVAAKPEEATTIEDGVASTKITMSLITLLLAGVAEPLLGTLGPIMWMLVLAQVLDGAIDWLFAVQKVHGQFAQEARFMTVASLLHSALLISVAMVWPQPMQIACGFLVSKFLQFIGVVLLTRRVARLPKPWVSLRSQWKFVVASKAYSLDVGLGVMTSQTDTILVRLLFGSQAAGLYQAGMRVVTGFQSFSAVAGNVFLPRLASAQRNLADYVNVVSQVRRVYSVLTLALAAGVLTAGMTLTSLGYGSAYSELHTLWPWLAGLMAVRIWSATYGLQLTAIGQQKFRSAVNFCAVLVTAFGMWLASLSPLGLHGVALTLLTSAVLIMFAYGWRLNRLSVSA